MEQLPASSESEMMLLIQSERQVRTAQAQLLRGWRRAFRHRNPYELFDIPVQADAVQQTLLAHCRNLLLVSNQAPANRRETHVKRMLQATTRQRRLAQTRLTRRAEPIQAIVAAFTLGRKPLPHVPENIGQMCFNSEFVDNEFRHNMQVASNTARINLHIPGDDERIAATAAYYLGNQLAIEQHDMEQLFLELYPSAHAGLCPNDPRELTKDMAAYDQSLRIYPMKWRE